MARKIIHQLVDDLDGTVLDAGEGESVSFAIDGKSYEIDLTDENAAKLRAAVEPFVSAGRRVLNSSSSARRSTRKASSGRDLAAVRTWARENGHSINDRGRVPENILQAYDAAH